MTLKEFINHTLITEIADIQQKENHHFLSFGLISQGIELLGACLDTEAFHKTGKSRQRFDNAVKTLFPKKYHQFIEKAKMYNLFENLRCGLCHVLLPKSELELIQKSEEAEFNAKHLDIKNIRGSDRLVLVSQDFFADFKNACHEIVKRIDAKSIDIKKISGDFLSVDP